MWEGRQAPTLLGIRDYDSNYTFVFLSFCQDKNDEHFCISQDRDNSDGGDGNLCLCFQYFKYSEQDSAEPLCFVF